MKMILVLAIIVSSSKTACAQPDKLSGLIFRTNNSQLILTPHYAHFLTVVSIRSPFADSIMALADEIDLITGKTFKGSVISRLTKYLEDTSRGLMVHFLLDRLTKSLPKDETFTVRSIGGYYEQNGLLFSADSEGQLFADRNQLHENGLRWSRKLNH